MTTHVNLVPEWLSAWRERQGVSAPAQPVAAPSTPEQARAARTPRPDSQGFLEPRDWPCDDGTRREAVLDTDHNPPRVVRFVGWQPCMRCRRQYFSPDVARVRMCVACKEAN